MVTAAPAWKPLPEMMTTVPPPAGPDAGKSEAMVGIESR